MIKKTVSSSCMRCICRFSKLRELHLDPSQGSPERIKIHWLEWNGDGSIQLSFKEINLKRRSRWRGLQKMKKLWCILRSVLKNCQTSLLSSNNCRAMSQPFYHRLFYLNKTRSINIIPKWWKNWILSLKARFRELNYKFKSHSSCAHQGWMMLKKVLQIVWKTKRTSLISLNKRFLSNWTTKLPTKENMIKFSIEIILKKNSKNNSIT